MDEIRHEMMRIFKQTYICLECGETYDLSNGWEVIEEGDPQAAHYYDTSDDIKLSGVSTS